MPLCEKKKKGRIGNAIGTAHLFHKVTVCDLQMHKVKTFPLTHNRQTSLFKAGCQSCYAERGKRTCGCCWSVCGERG